MKVTWFDPESKTSLRGAPAVIILVKKKRRRIIRHSRRGKAGEEERKFVRRFPGFTGLVSIAAAVDLY
jgi:hypothetical protein